MKVMRSSKAGSVCGDCGTAIAVGDPIAYFGPGRVFGLTCHRNEKTEKHLRSLLKEEGSTDEWVEKFVQEVYAGKEKKEVKLPEPETRQEWVVRVELDRDQVKIPEVMDMLKWLLKNRYCEQPSTQLHMVEFRAPRGVAEAMTKSWAESFVKEFCPFGIGEVCPKW